MQSLKLPSASWGLYMTGSKPPEWIWRSSNRFSNSQLKQQRTHQWSLSAFICWQNSFRSQQLLLRNLFGLYFWELPRMVSLQITDPGLIKLSFCNCLQLFYDGCNRHKFLLIYGLTLSSLSRIIISIQCIWMFKKKKKSLYIRPGTHQVWLSQYHCRVCFWSRDELYILLTW